MKILTAAQIKEADAYTIANEPITSIDLMERAATECFKWIASRISKEHHFKIFCGTGNNGGDGLALATMLHKDGYIVSTYIIRANSNASADFTTNESKLIGLGNAAVHDINNVSEMPTLNANDIVIDAIFGTGLNKPAADIYFDVIRSINDSNSHVIAINIPSGLFADQSSVASSIGPAVQIIKAAYTLSFQLYKFAFFIRENADYIGEVIMLPIGLNETFINNCESNIEMIDAKMIHQILKRRKPFSHKGNYGHAAIVAGSFGKIGAAVLSAQACLRAGVGLLTVYVPACGYEILQTTTPEAMVVTDTNERTIATTFNLDSYTAVGIGPGLGTTKETEIAVKYVLQNFRKPIVVDADALNLVSENKEWMNFIIPESIFSPHPAEFERLIGKCKNDFERNKLQIEFSKKYKVFIILKGKYTLISCPDGNSYINPTGNPGMAKGGSGDTLTGMLTALLAQGYTSKEACIAGVYLHGLAADIAVKETGEFSLLATDIIENIGKAFMA